MRLAARYVYVGTSWVLLGWVLVTIFVAGMALFVRAPYWGLHREVGWASGLALLLLILAGLVGWIPRRLTVWLIALIGLHTLHLFLPALKANLPMASALHPLSASLLAWLSLAHARRAQHLLPEGRAAGLTGDAEQPRTASAEPQ